jgi:adenylate cyclase
VIFSRKSAMKLGGFRIFFLGVLVLLCALIADVLFRDGLSRLSDLVFDGFQRTHPRTATLDPGVVVVDIDEASLAKLGQWPWSRDHVGEMVERLGRQGAAVIAFDVVFTEPDRTSLALQVVRLAERGIKLTEPVAADVLDNDLAFAQAIARHPVVMGVALTDETGLAVAPPPAGLSFAGSDPRKFLPTFRGGLSNLPVLTEAATGVGSFSFVPAADNIIRSMPLVSVASGEIYPGLGIEALRVAQGVPGLLLRSSDASGEVASTSLGLTDIRVGVLDVPVGPDGRFRVHYSGMPHMTVIPAWQLLAQAEGAFRDQLEGRIVLIGTSAIGLRDIVATPMAAAEPGVNVHAELVDQILNQSFLNHPDWARGAELLAALLLGMLLLLVLGGGRPVVSSAVFVILSLLALGGSWWAYRQQQLLLDPLPALLTLTMLFLVMLPMLLFMGNRERRFVRDAFGRYLSPTLVERLSQDAGALKLGGEERPITVMFSDIRGFTTLSENLSPTELTELLNGFLTPMTDVLLAHDATIDKYIGDAIMAFWNAPLDIPEHSRKACLGALAMAKAVDDMNATRGTRLRIGVGLHCGNACVGNLGSEQRFSYSAIGDTVNLASRVEGMTKYYGQTIMVTESVREQAADLAFVEVDRVRVVGRSEPVILHALLGDAALAQDAGFQDRAAAHASFLALYRRGEFAGATQQLVELRQNALLEMQPVYASYAERLETLCVSPPAHWDGVFTATSK